MSLVAVDLAHWRHLRRLAVGLYRAGPLSFWIIVRIRTH
jgi:hypothetical protein